MYSLLDEGVCGDSDGDGGDGDDDDNGDEDDGDNGNEDDGANGTIKLPVLVLPIVLLLVSITCSV